MNLGTSRNHTTFSNDCKVSSHTDSSKGSNQTIRTSKCTACVGRFTEIEHDVDVASGNDEIDNHSQK
jgi:hypothetical protein